MSIAKPLTIPEMHEAVMRSRVLLSRVDFHFNYSSLESREDFNAAADYVSTVCAFALEKLEAVEQSLDRLSQEGGAA